MGILLGSSLFATIIIIAIITIHIVVITAIINTKKETRKIRIILEKYLKKYNYDHENNDKISEEREKEIMNDLFR